MSNYLFFIFIIGHGMQFKKDARGLSKNKNKKSLPIPVIPVSDTKLLQEQPTIPITMVMGEPTPPSDMDKNDSAITILDCDREKEDFEMFEESDSFWEDEQRLTDS